MKADAIVDKLLETDELPAQDDPASYLAGYVANPNTVYFELLNYDKRYNLELCGKVTRTDHHYVHQRSTHFELEGHGEMPAEAEEQINRLMDEVQSRVGEEIVNINNKIYKALELEWDYMQSDENIDELIGDSGIYRFNREGVVVQGKRGVPFERLNNAAKERAREWWRDGMGYDEWWDAIYEEWTAELEDMGFGGVEINHSGFSSQGDGASFTATSFDLAKWAAYFSSNKPKEQGHPYSDDLFRDK